jgi:hypothetical protein
VLRTSWTKLILQIIFSWVVNNWEKKLVLNQGNFKKYYKVGIIGQHFPKIQWNIVRLAVCANIKKNKLGIHVHLRPIPPLKPFEKLRINLKRFLLISVKDNKIFVATTNFFIKWPLGKAFEDCEGGCDKVSTQKNCDAIQKIIQIMTYNLQTMLLKNS